MGDLRIGEKVVGRRAVPLSGIELEQALWSSIREVMSEAGLTTGQREDLERDLEREFRKCSMLGRGHLSFPNVIWKVEAGSGGSGVWASIAVQLTENQRWEGQVGVPDRETGFGEVRQERTEVPDLIRERWGLSGKVEVRGADGRLRSREIKFGGPRGTAAEASVREVPEAEPESPKETILTLKEGVGSLGAARLDKAGGREFVKLDKEDLVAEPPAPEVKQPGSVEPQPAPSGVKLRGKGGAGK